MVDKDAFDLPAATQRAPSACGLPVGAAVCFSFGVAHVRHVNPFSRRVLSSHFEEARHKSEGEAWRKSREVELLHSLYDSFDHSEDVIGKMSDQGHMCQQTGMQLWVCV